LTKATHYGPTSIDPAAWISQAEAARLRSVSRQAIAKLVSSGRLQTITVGGRKFVSRADVMAFEPLPPGRRKGAGRE
jgi:excisionase family DNA binding protein